MLTKQEYQERAEKAKALVGAFRDFWAASEHAQEPAENLKSVLDKFAKESLVVFGSHRESTFVLRRSISGDPIFLDPQGREIAFLNFGFSRHLYRAFNDPCAQVLKVMY